MTSSGFSGSVDLGNLAWSGSDMESLPRKTDLEPGQPLRVLRGPGLSLNISDPTCTLLVDQDVIVVVRGDLRFRANGAGGCSRNLDPVAQALSLYKAHGEKALDQFSGHYCVLLIDGRRQNALFATDRFSIWPICFATEGSKVHFSDRANTVPIPWVHEIDPQALFDYFYFHVIPAPRTVYDRVHRLEGGCALSLDSHGVRIVRYWNPQFEEGQTRSMGSLRDEFRSLLRRSVAHEATTGSVGCFLSGGTDSSTVAGLLGEVTGRAAQSYSIGFAADGYDEMEYARIAARHFGTEQHEYYLQPQDIVESLPALAAHFDQPFGNSSALPTYYCAKIARSSGLTKLLAGDGGDELFGGNARYAKQRIFEAYHTIPSALRTTLIEPLSSSTAVTMLPLGAKLTSYVEQARLKLPDRLETYNLLARLGVDEVLTPGFLNSVEVLDSLRQQRGVYDRYPASSLINRMLAYDWKYTLADNDLIKVRGGTSLAGISVGFPLLADELVDFSLRLPPEMKLKGLKLRYFFKEALSDFLPRDIIRKKKHGFGLPFGLWLMKDAGLQRMAQECLQRLAARRIVREDFLEQLLPLKVPAHPGYFGEMVWLLLALEYWLSAQAPDYRVG